MSLHPPHAHVAAAALNQTVGDWAGNRARVVEAIAQARARGVRLLLCPEMCLSGYSLGDRLLRRGTLERSWASLMALAEHTADLVLVAGLPVRHDDALYNVAAVVAGGRLVGLVPKENLATGDVQYENRWYGGWPPGRVETFTGPDGTTVPIGRLVFDAPGIGRFGVEVCEDGWKGLRPGSALALAGARLVLNPSASWFVVGKHAVRRRLVAELSRQDRVAYVYASLMGCDATRLVFDGSAFVAAEGQIVSEGPRFAFHTDVVVTDAVVDLESLASARLEEGSWRQQLDHAKAGHFGPVPPVVPVPGDFASVERPPAPAPYWRAGRDPGPVDPSLEHLVASGAFPRALAPADVPMVELELALALGLREYSRKSGVARFALALSGGRDSSMVAVLLHRMAVHEAAGAIDPADGPPAASLAGRLTTTYLATDHSGSATREAAAALAHEIGAKHLDGAIQRTVDTHLDVIRQMTGAELSWDDPVHDLALQNVQARLRGSLVWMVANLDQALLLSTSNKSEAAVGYATMDGDTSGGLSPIADVPKSLVGEWLAWAADTYGYASLGQVLATPATAELRPTERAQTDEGDLMPYDILDQLMDGFVQRGLSPVELFDRLWPTLADRYAGDPTAFAAHIRLFVRKLCFAQWKRERFAISFRVTAFDLDPKTGFRFPPVQAPFTEELAELDAHVAALVAHTDR